MNFLLILFVSAITLAITPKGESSETRTCRIIFPDRPRNAPKKVYLFDGQKNLAVRLPNLNFSPIIELPMGDISLLMSPQAITNMENLPQNAPEIKISKNITDFYLIVTSDAENELIPFKIEMVSLSNGALKLGETLWINQTDLTIQAKLAESELLIPSKSQKVTKSPVPKSSYYRAEFTYKKDEKEDFKKITEQKWWHDNNSRHLGFIINNGKRLPKIFFFRDFRAKH